MDFLSFGRHIEDENLSKVVRILFLNATLKTSREKAKTGQKHFNSFALQKLGFSFMPLSSDKISLKALLLCFFVAHLYLHRRKYKFSTIRNYVGHVRARWAAAGSELSPFDQMVIKRVFRGLRALRPKQVDGRVAFLLPHYNLPKLFTCPFSLDHLLFKAAVIFGFFGMFRFSTFGKLTAQCIVLIDVLGREFDFSEACPLLYSSKLAGFYFKFASKCHPRGRAYFCLLSDLNQPWSALCPVSVLRLLGSNRLLRAGQIFQPTRVSSRTLGAYMSFLACSRNRFTPHSLRIGGHTFFSIQNMHEDFVQFLGPRAVTKTSQLYYRARAADNILRLRIFLNEYQNVGY